jgi:hypothetical protein
MHSRLIRSGLLPLVALGSLAMVGASLAQPERSRSGGDGQPPRRSPQPDGQGRDGQGRARGEVGQTVEQCMKMMNGAARRLKEQVGDASKKEDNLKLVWAMQKNALQAKMLEPNHLGDGDRTRQLAEFRKDQNDLMRSLLKLEDEVASGKADAASATFASIAQMKESEHRKFKVKD